MSQKHLDSVMNTDFAWFYNQPEFYSVTKGFFQRWIDTQAVLPTDVSNPEIMQVRARSILKFFSEGESFALQAYNELLKNNNIPNFTSIFGETFLDVSGYLISKYGKPRNMINISGLKNLVFDNDKRWWKFAVIKGLWEYASPLDKSLIEYQLLSTPDFQEDNGFFQKIIRDVATPYVDYLAKAGAAVTVVTAAAAFATAAPAIASDLGLTASSQAAAATTTESGLVGTTLADASVTIGAESAATTAAASSGGLTGSLSSIFTSEVATYAAGAGALLESEAKKALEKEGEKALKNILSNGGDSDAAPGAPTTGTNVSADTPQLQNGDGLAIGGALALLLLLL